jgi:hypothetical protein
LGFSANDPLLRTGTLRDSIGHVVEGNVGYVGTNDKVAPFQEFGTSKIPPRPFLGGALAATEQEIPKIFGRLVGAAIRGGGPAYHELRELLHVVKEVGHELKEAGKELLEDDWDERRLSEFSVRCQGQWDWALERGGKTDHRVTPMPRRSRNLLGALITIRQAEEIERWTNAMACGRHLEDLRAVYGIRIWK